MSASVGLPILTRRAAVAGLASVAFSTRYARAQGTKQIVIAEPVHNLGYAPVYIAMDQGLFAKRGLDVSLLLASNGGHVAALLSGQVWGNIGGPESDAMANVGRTDKIVTICNLVNRANMYLVARKGLAPKSKSKADLAAFFRGKRFALSRFGGTPDLVGRWFMHEIGLDPKTDIEPVNNADMAAVLALIKQNVADIAITQEPFITAGVEQGLWDQPFYAFPSLGDYPYSVVSAKQSTCQRDPQTVQAFVDAIVEALHIANRDRAAVEAMSRKEFPTLSAGGTKATLDRIYADHIWSTDGMVSEKGYLLDMDVVAKAGTFSTKVPYADVVNMTFVKRASRG